MYWKNSNFQWLNFIVGKCHTVDEAYRVLTMNLEERLMALEKAKADALRAKANYKKSMAIIHDKQVREWEKLEAQADIIELEFSERRNEALVEAAKKEVDYLEGLLKRLEPHRKYGHLPVYEASQAAQEEEWLKELLFRAENFMLSQGRIPHDHLATMRVHPKWESDIIPKLESIREDIQKGEKISLSVFKPVSLLNDYREGE